VPGPGFAGARRGPGSGAYRFRGLDERRAGAVGQTGARFRPPQILLDTVYETLLLRRKVAYTTVMTMMKILERKKYLKKTQVDRAYVYRPAQPKRQVIGAMVKEFVNRVFNGSAQPLLVHLVEDQNLTREELEEIAILRRKP
jgi:predicted transcriptional regulator